MTHPTVVDPAFAPPTDAPGASAALVSVMIRSIDRSHLQAALASVALQTYSRIEVVVIAALPGHRGLPAQCGPFPLRLVQTDCALPRSKAANRALEEARGERLLFLDDDDWLMPGHVARLAEIMDHQPHALVAYTGVALANDSGEPLGQVMDLPFDGVRQLAGNFTPIHAVMFSRQLVARGVRFDESLDRYEDWDFWLQLARHTVFVHLPGVSAVYRIHQSSGVHEDAGPGGAATQGIYARWRHQIEEKLVPVMQRVWASFDLERSLNEAKAENVRLQAAIAQLQAEQIQDRHALEASSNHVRAMLESRSWKITAPLRWLSGKLKAGN